MANHSLIPTAVNPGGLTQLINNLGRDCHPTQFVREFVRNGIEACQRTPSGGGRVTVDYDRQLAEENGVFKITFTDSGDGMSAEQMLHLLNNLSASGGTGNDFVNYGVGAKISALTRNHAGVLYQSWRDGVGHAVLIKYHAQQGVYGIQGIDQGAETFYALALPPSAKPEGIGSSGTRVTLFGMSESQDTMMPPEGAGGIRESWLALYLNSRFFVLPNGIELAARIGYYREANPKHNYLTGIRGQKAILDEKAEIKGTFNLEDGLLYWWVLPKGVDGHGRELLKGHTALVHEGEVFDISDARSNRSAFFGILVGRERVTIYVEPKNVVQNTARTNLVRPDGASIVWDAWQDRFRSNMPTELRSFLDGLLDASTKDSHTESIRERLKNLKALYKLSRYRPRKDGPILAVEDSAAEYGTGQMGKGERGASATKGGSAGDIAGSLATALLTSLAQGQVGVPSVAVEPDPFPKVRWVGVEGNTQLIDRAAEYVQPDHVILANKDFQGVQDLIAYFGKIYGDNPDVLQLIDDEVRQAFEQALTECVAGALSLKNRKHWNPTEFEAALSREALTTAVMPRYWMVSHVRRVLGSKIKGQVENGTL